MNNKWTKNIIKNNTWYEKTYGFNRKHTLRRLSFNYNKDNDSVSILTEVYDPRTNQNYLDDIKSFNIKDLELILGKVNELKLSNG